MPFASGQDGAVFGRRSFAEKQSLLAKYHGQEVIVYGFSMLQGVAGVLDAPPPVSDYVRLRKTDGTVESIFLGDIWQLVSESGEVIGQW